MEKFLLYFCCIYRNDDIDDVNNYKQKKINVKQPGKNDNTINV